MGFTHFFRQLRGDLCPFPVWVTFVRASVPRVPAECLLSGCACTGVGGLICHSYGAVSHCVKMEAWEDFEQKSDRL